MTNRTQVAEYVANNIKTRRAEVIHSAAAWLVSTGRSRQAPYLARDIAASLARHGYLLARITTARPLSPEARQSIETFLKTQTGATEIELQLQTNPHIIGGVRIETPTTELDATVRAKLAILLEGV